MATQAMPSGWDVMMVGDEEEEKEEEGGRSLAARWTEELGHFPPPHSRVRPEQE